MNATISCLQPGLFLLWVICHPILPNSNEIKAHFEPGKLTLRSDVVLVGRQISETVIRVEQVWKGDWDERLIEIPHLPDFQTECWQNSENRMKLSNQCLVFVNTRLGNRIVANGLYRVQADGGVLGHSQFVNPGPYCLEVNPKNRSLTEIKELVDAAEAQRPVLQRESLRRLSSLFWSNDEFVKLHPELVGDRSVPLVKRNEWDASPLFFDFELKNELSHLAGITNVGDDFVFRNIDTMLRQNKEWDYDFTDFLGNFTNATAEQSLIRIYEQSRETRILGMLGRLGRPTTAKYLKSVAANNADREHQYAAVVALGYVYTALANRLDDRSAHSTALEIYALIDDSAEVAKIIAHSPGILSSIPYEGSVERLKRFLEEERKGNKSESRIFQLERDIQICQQLILITREARFVKEK